MKQMAVTIGKTSCGKVSKNLYGQFIEQLDDCVMGGIYDRESPLSDPNGIRRDVLEKVKELSPPVIRFPGGTVMCIYHWEDAVGPLEKRRKRKNLIWGGVLHPDFGTAEFVEYCREIGAEPMLCVNMASGTPEEASHWVEYCNSTDDTYYANLRRSHGYEKPFGVKYWCIGNECYAEPDIGLQNDVQTYIREAREFIKFMKLQDPEIQTVIVGSDDIEGWDRPVLDALGDMTDYLSYHFYAAEDGMGLYGPFFGEKRFVEKLAQLDALLSEYPEKPEHFNVWYRFPPRKGRIKLLIDEWNIWQYQNDGCYGLHMRYNWRDAVWVASMLNRFLADEHIAGANMAQLCNIIAPIVAEKDGCFVQTIFTPCALYRRYMHGERLRPEISGQYSIDGGKAGEIEALSAAAVQNGGATCLALVNRDFENAVMISLPESFTTAILCHADPLAQNDITHNCVSKETLTVPEDHTLMLPVGAIALIFTETKKEN